jgi:hypothetical protein
LKVHDVGPFQEVTLVGHSVTDFETPAFDAFLKKAVRAFLSLGKRGELPRNGRSTPVDLAE